MPADRPSDERASGPLWSEPGSLLEHVPVAVFGIDDDNRICYWGPGARELFGYRAADALSRPGALILPGPPGGPDACSRMAERGRTLGYWRGRLRATHQDGTAFDCGFRVFPVAGAEGTSVVMTLASRSDELDRVKTNLAFLDALFETCPIGLVMLDEELRYLHLNQALADIDGLPIEAHLGRRLPEIMITSDGGEYERMLRAVSAGGEPVTGVLVGLRTRGHPDRDRVLSVSFFPLTQAVGTRPGLGGLLVDVTDREQAIAEATAGRRRLALLDRASARIGTTLDVRTTAQELVEAAVPDFADGAVVELVEWQDEHEPFDPALPVAARRIASGTVLPPPAPELVGSVEAVRYPPGSAIHQMLRTGRPISVPVDQEFMVRTVLDASRARLLADSGLTCLLLAPLIARGTVQGIAIFGRSAARPAFTEQDLSLAGELASRAALCLDNARLYSRERDIALTLQRALLPSSLATSPYLRIAHRYLPGGRVTEVGGDWYDVVALPDHRVALVVGDVMGHGVSAAAAMGRLRITAKTLARHDQEPDRLLTELDHCADEAGIELATCLYIRYDPATGRTRMASAGHPPPLVRHPDGRIELIGEVLGVPLGVGGHPFRTTEVELPDGATLALYTDGLIEARGHDIDEGLDALRTELGQAFDSLEAAADRILARLAPSAPTDDTVLLLARVHRMEP
ncbi:SpoIIE family protein phosphatase [Streptomyces sp. XD-27]|uniref:SpoIIE family protein phosphatase n=1 Tax=Streptomyces sp. XD-27 TaxID=3062779 RepID=UPI0026F4312A|nr:SpoIIE family protein phosphatase [Streptomyces sp. XD-27]WKX73808.1 SpoIIE family protein phosphatase [Streptomyces sp. XD-27]